MTRARVLSYTRWPHNEWEGEVRLSVYPHEFSARLVATASQWATLQGANEVDVAVCFLRYGSWEPDAPGFQIPATNVSGVLWGTVGQVDGETLTLREAAWITVDLDLPTGSSPPDLQAGQGIRVEGQFEVELL